MEQRSDHWRAGSETRALLVPEVWSLGVLNVVAAALCLVATVAPFTDHHFVAAGIALGSCFLAAAALVFTLNGRYGRRAQLGFVIADIGLFSGLVAQARNPQGAALASFAFLWTTMYAAAFLPRAETRAVFAITAVASLASLGVDGETHWEAVWVILTATGAVAATVIGRSAWLLREEAETDELTELLNRRGFAKSAALARSVASRAGIELTLVIVDLDDFKSVNDTAGHAAGDRLLVEATRAWSESLREGDLLCRYGGDEFVLLLPALSARQLELVLERLAGAHPIRWTAGAANWRDGEALEAAIERADRELYANKAARHLG